MNRLANVLLSNVRDTINFNAADVPAKLQKMIKLAQVTLALELGREIDCENCSDAEKEFITLLARNGNVTLILFDASGNTRHPGTGSGRGQMVPTRSRRGSCKR